MANGRLGAVNLSATTNTTAYSGPASGKFATVFVNFCNRNATPVAVRLALATSGTPGVDEWIWYDKLIPGNEPALYAGINVAYGEQVVVRSDTANVTVVVWGCEEISI